MDFTAVNEYIAKVEQSETEVFDFDKNKKLKVGVDLGTAFIVIVVLDEDNNPVACEKRAARVLKDGVVVDYVGACNIVRELKGKLEDRIGIELEECAIAMPSGTESSLKTHMYVAESAGFRVINVLDEPTAANAIYKITDGAIVDIGGGTTGLAIFKDGKVVQTEDEATGGYHLSLVISGSMDITLDEAEEIKMNYDEHPRIMPIVKPVVQKMVSITKKYIDPDEIETVYLCGGTCCLTGIEEIFEKELGINVEKAENPFLVTPAGIAVNCVEQGQ